MTAEGFQSLASNADPVEKSGKGSAEPPLLLGQLFLQSLPQVNRGPVCRALSGLVSHLQALTSQPLRAA